jgi:hypothetical protein
VGLVRPSSNRCQALSPMYSLGQGSTMVRGDILARCDIHLFTLPPYPGNKIAPVTSLKMGAYLSRNATNIYFY